MDRIWESILFSENAFCLVLRFTVDRTSGRITTASSRTSYDRETAPEYFLTIMATDGGGATTTTRVHVTLDDVNDQHPVFLRPEYSAFLKENSHNFDVGVTTEVLSIGHTAHTHTRTQKSQCERLWHDHSPNFQCCITLQAMRANRRWESKAADHF